MEEPKPKKQLTQAQLDQLAKAREKANAVRKRNAEMKRKEKKLKELSARSKRKSLTRTLGGMRSLKRKSLMWKSL